MSQLTVVNENFTGLQNENKIELIAHRGFAELSLPNTMLAFTTAAQNGADAMELDVMVTSDGKLVVFHDQTVDAKTDGTGTVRDLTFDYLRTLTLDKANNTKFSNEGIPLLSSVLSYAKEKNIPLYVEVKQVRTQSDIELILNEIALYKMESLCTVIAFHPPYMDYIRSLNQNIKIGLLGDASVGVEGIIDSLAVLGNSTLLWRYNVFLANPSIVSYAESKSVGVGAWTVLSTGVAKELLSLNVNKIIADRNLLSGVNR